MDTRKIIQALVYFATQQKDKTIDNMKAYKLLWLADRWHLRQYGRTISGDVYYAMPFGVVPSDAKCILEGSKTKKTNAQEVVEEYISILAGKRYAAKKAADINVFSDSDIDAMRLIVEKYNSMSAKALSELSHKFPEWKYYEKELSAEDTKNSYKINMDLFFENEKDGKGIFVDDEELLDLSKEMYHLEHGFA